MKKDGLRAYTCGSGLFGEVGHGELKDCRFPRGVETLRDVDITFGSGGGRHLCMMSKSGDIFSCGKGDHGQLGIGAWIANDNERVVESDPSSFNQNGAVSAPIKVLMGSDEGEGEGSSRSRGVPRALSSGFDHTVVICRDGSVKTFGRGTEGRLGVMDGDGEDSNRHVYTPEAVSIQGERFVAAGAGLVHTALVTDKGELYTYGFSGNGRLGHSSSYEDESSCSVSPRKVGGLEGKRVVQAVAGWSHTVVLTSDGEVYTCGLGINGQLGHGDDNDEFTLKRVEALVFKGDPIVQVSAGYTHTAALTYSGKMYTFGYGYQGQLGHGTFNDELKPVLVQHLEEQHGTRVIQIAAGGHHTAARLQNGKVLTFGNNEYGQLGHGTTKNTNIPKVVEMSKGRKVEHISAGGTHTLMLAPATPFPQTCKRV